MTNDLRYVSSVIWNTNICSMLKQFVDFPQMINKYLPYETIIDATSDALQMIGIKCVGQNIFNTYKLERFCNNEHNGDSYSVRQLQRAIAPLSAKLWQRREVSLPSNLPGLQKVGKSKIVGQQCIWGQCPVNHSNKLYHQSCYRWKNNQMTLRISDIVVAVAAAV